MKRLIALLTLCATPVFAEPIKYTCPAPQDIKGDALPNVHHVANEWKGDASLTKVRWFFNGTEAVGEDKKGNAVLKCNYGNRGDKLTLEMATPHKVSACTQDTCEKAMGKGSGKKMLESCTYSCKE